MYRKKNNRTNNGEPKHKLVEEVSLTQKNINVLKGINHFSNLWNLSLVNCRFQDDQTASELLKPLSAFAYLGTLDLSYTDITFEWLQRYIRPLSIQHLKLYGIPYFPWDDPQCRGFLIFCLPSTWMINDQFITYSERRHWHRYYSPSAAALSVTADTHNFNTNKNLNHARSHTGDNVGGGQYSIYIRKYYINPDSSYIPSSEQDELYDKLGDIEAIKKEEYNYFYKNTDNILSEENKNKSKPGRLWSDKAKLLLSKMPKTFYMPMEQDKWRLKILMQQFNIQLFEENDGTEMEQFYRKNNILEHILIHDSNIYYDANVPVKDKTRFFTEYRIILLILLFGSLIPEFPKEVIQKGLEYFFAKKNDELYEPFIHNPEAYESSKLAEEDENIENDKTHYWVQNPTSPLLWSNKLMLNFLNLLISRIEMESASAASFQNSNDTALLDKKTLSIMKLYIYNRSLNNLNNNDYSIYGSYAYLRKTQQVYLAMLNLRLIQLLTFIPTDMFFLTNFQTLYNIYAKAILLLIPLTYLETSDYNFFMSEEEMINYLRDDSDSKKQQEINQKRFEEEMDKDYEKNKEEIEGKNSIDNANGNTNKHTQNSTTYPYKYLNQTYQSKYKKTLNDILIKKVSPLLLKTSKYQRLFVNTLTVHGRALELRYYLNNSIMHVYEAEEIYDTMNKLLEESNLMVKGQKVFFNRVEVSLIEEVKENLTPPSNTNTKNLLNISSTPQTVLANVGKTKSTGNISNTSYDTEDGKHHHHGHHHHALRHRQSMRSLKSLSQHSLAKQRSVNISRASLLSAASSALLSNLWDVDENFPPGFPNSNNPMLSNGRNTPYLKKNSSSLLDKSILDDSKLLKNIYAINETIMNDPKVMKKIAKIEKKTNEDIQEPLEDPLYNGNGHSRYSSVNSSKHSRYNSYNSYSSSKQTSFYSNNPNSGNDEKLPIRLGNKQKDISLLKGLFNKPNRGDRFTENKYEIDTEDNIETEQEAEVDEESNEELKKSNGKRNGSGSGNGKKKSGKGKSKGKGKKGSGSKSDEKINNKEDSNENNGENKKGLSKIEQLLLEEMAKDKELEEQKEREEKEKEEKERQEKEKQEKEKEEKERQEKEEKELFKILDENVYDKFFENNSDESNSQDSDQSWENENDDYIISQDFSIRNTLSNNNKNKRKGNTNVNVYVTKKSDDESEDEGSGEDEFINYILYHTDISSNKNKNKNDNDNTNDNNNNDIDNNTNNPNQNLPSNDQKIDINTDRISYHISRMPILGSARNYRKKTEKDKWVDKLNSFYNPGSSKNNESNLSLFDSKTKLKKSTKSSSPIPNQNNNQTFIVTNSPTKKKK